MSLKPLETSVPGHVGGSTLTVLALRGDAATGQLEVAEVHDNSLALGDIPTNARRCLVPAADFRPWPQRTVFVGGQPFVYQWIGGHVNCSRCDARLEHFAYAGKSGGDVRERGQGAGQPLWYCDDCVRSSLDIGAT